MDEPSRRQLIARIRDDHDRDWPACTLEGARELLEHDPSSAWGRLYLGLALTTLARYDEAIAEIRRGLRRAPASRRHLFLGAIARAYERRARPGMAERYYRLAIEAHPDDTCWRIMLGTMFSARGDLEGASVVLRGATRCATGDLDEAWLNLGRVLRALERYGEARACFARALAITDDYPEAALDLADCDEVLRRRAGGGAR